MLMISRGFRLIWPLLLCLLACGGSPETLATFEGGEVTSSQLAAHLLALPENHRRIPDGEQASKAWIEEQIERLAVESILAASPEMAQLLDSPDLEARRLWVRTAALQRALSRQLAAAIQPTGEEISQRVNELAESSTRQPVLNFSHLFLRLDSASSPRERQDRRQLAERLLAELHRGADFADLARRHSDSAGAASGGLVVNARPSDLEETSRAAIAALQEDQLSPVVETRTGLHIFRLLRRLQPQPIGAAQLNTAAQRSLSQEAFETARRELLERLRADVEPLAESAEAPWSIGHFSLDQALIEQLMAAGDDRARRHLVDRLLLASEAINRGLEDDELRLAIERQQRAMALERVLQLRREALVDGLDTESLQAFYDAQPSLFNLPQQAHLELLFVPQGRDAFATQLEVEAYVRQLRGGASFAELARRYSRGPRAQEGGDLGWLTASQWAQLGPAIGAAIPQLEEGAVSDPIYCTDRIMTQQPGLLMGGFAVLRVRERRDEQPRGFDEALDDVRRAYARERQQDLDRQLEQSLLEEAAFRMVRSPEVAELLP